MDNFKVGDKVRIISIEGIPEYIIDQGFKVGAIFTIRSIAEKTFHPEGPGLRLKGITTYSDLTGFEKAFKRTKFKLVKKPRK